MKPQMTALSPSGWNVRKMAEWVVDTYICQLFCRLKKQVILRAAWRQYVGDEFKVNFYSADLTNSVHIKLNSAFFYQFWLFSFILF